MGRPTRKPQDLPPEPAGPNDTAYVILSLDRATGRVDVDESFSTPMETWAMIEWAGVHVTDKLEDARKLDE